ncbi:MAG: hypothetical protein J5I92_03220 [Thiogranum sp.]|nr:hypothetical protein [Thiogranum sp.]
MLACMNFSSSLAVAGTLALLGVMLCTPAFAQQPQSREYEDQDVYIRLVLRSPAQLTAFYIAREFDRDSIERILATCFVTPIIHNKAIDVLWLELDNWQFTRNGEPIPRIKRDYWTEQWRQTALPQAHQSTFGWTLMPEVRDLRLDESVGGSVVIPRQPQPFTLTARFRTGADRQGPLKTVVFEDVPCVTDTP